MSMDTKKNLKIKFPITNREISSKLCIVFTGLRKTINYGSISKTFILVDRFFR